MQDKKCQSYKNISQKEHKNPISNKFYVKIKQKIMVWQFTYKCMAICISKLPIGTLPYYGNLPVGHLPSGRQNDSTNSAVIWYFHHHCVGFKLDEQS